MKVSIITVVYNNEKTVADCIDSVLSQTYSNIEYIIIDGNSKDSTVAIIKSYGDKITTFVSEQDNGIYDAMNKGLALATGDVVGILNSDDMYQSNTVIKKIVYHFQNSGCQAVFSDLIYVNYNNTSKIVRYWKSSLFTEDAFNKGWHPAHPTFFAKREVYQKFGVFNLNYEISADFELMLRFIQVNKISTHYIPEILVKMRLGGESNNSVHNIIKGNKNIKRAFLEHGLPWSRLYTAKRLMKKLIQYLPR
jgi:glycosyltransferase involved in cell wall biosynthesis